MSGVPSLLGREGGLALGEALVWAFLSGEGDLRTGLDTLRTDFGDEVSSRKYCEDLRGGGLGGGGGKFLVFFLMVASRTVELDDEEVRDSLTAARP
jgi:hypothetical protein